MRFLLLLLACLCSPLAECANDAFQTMRRGGLTGGLWQDAGLPGLAGTILTNQTIYTNVPLLATAADLEAVMNNCPSNQVIVLTNGVYTMTDAGGRLELTKNGVIIRGRTDAQGNPTTQISGLTIWLGAWGDSTHKWPFDSLGASINVNSGLTPGSTSITLASAPNADITVGDTFMIDQNDDGSKVFNSTVSLVRRSGRNYNFMAMVTNISGSTIQFTPPLLGNYWAAAQDPEAFGWTTTAGTTYKAIGLENVVVTNGTSSEAMIGMGRAYGCWLRNVRVVKFQAASRAIEFRSCVNCYMRDSVVADQVGTVDNNSYAHYMVGASYCAIENNIFTNLALACPSVNAVGCSWGFNVAFGPSVYNPSTWNPEYFFPHGGHGYADLFEGNWLFGPIFLDDIFLGNNSQIAIVRNRLAGWLNGKTSDCKAFIFGQDNGGNHNTNTVLGNVMGYPGFHTTYASVFSIDAGVVGSIVTNNYNVADDGINSAETMSADTMLSSYRFTTQPEWWGDRQWPAFSPTAVATNVLYYTNLPAGYRSVYGEWPPAAAQGGGGQSIPPKLNSRIRLKR